MIRHYSDTPWAGDAVDGTSIETPTAALGYIFVSRFPTRTNGAGDFR
jgi:hypothetical protein